jgi:hypothetical protein
MLQRWLVSPTVGAAALLWPALSFANPRPLPFTYQHEQLAAGETEIEQFVDVTPIRVYSETGRPVWYAFSQFQTEYEHGLTDRLELGLYVTYVPGLSSGFSVGPRGTEGTGIKQRLRYQLAPSQAWPVDVSLYGEVVENDHELELEAKVLLQRRFGPARLIANVSGEREFYYDGKHDIVLTPSAGVTFEATPMIQPGIEWWMRAEYPEENPPHPRPFALGPQNYLGPALLLQFGSFWWSNGVYLRLNRTDHTLTPGEGFGLVWARTMIGIGL